MGKLRIHKRLRVRLTFKARVRRAKRMAESYQTVGYTLYQRRTEQGIARSMYR